jgi:hypothetical protein
MRRAETMTERKEYGMFEIDIVLPLQFYSTRSKHAEGEQRLMLAILSEAVDCFQKNAFATDHRRSRLFREAHDWVMSDARHVFSFRHICDVFSLDAGCIRRGLRCWRERRAVERAHGGRRNSAEWRQRQISAPAA